MLPLPLTYDEALDFFATIYDGKHHIPDDSGLRAEGGGIWSIEHYDELASFDYDYLTRYVLLAHERAIRVSVRGGRARRLRITISKRERGAESMTSDHPTIEQAVAKFRDHNHAPWAQHMRLSKEPLDSPPPARQAFDVDEALHTYGEKNP